MSFSFYDFIIELLDIDDTSVEFESSLPHSRRMREAASFAGHNVQSKHSDLVIAVAIGSLIWYCIVLLVCTIGYVQLWRYFAEKPKKFVWRVEEAPRVTIIRPVKGLEPSLYDCLASTFKQDYPSDKIQIRLCVSDPNDAAIPVLERVIRDHPSIDAQLLIESEDPVWRDATSKLGTNPKIRNMSRAYREATGDVIWVIDCNVWVGKGICSRMIAKLEGKSGDRHYKYVHLLPIVVDTVGTTTHEEIQGNSVPAKGKLIRTTSSTNTAEPRQGVDRTFASIGGGRLEELFLASAHPKFYTAINTVLIAPCSVGKSTMFRKSHLDTLTNGAGIDQFSENICEDQLIGDILWKKSLPGEKKEDNWGKHAMVFGDLAIQPMANMNLVEYWKRRVRWLRVRKFTVTLATFVEPGTESFFCSAYGAFAATTLPWFHTTLGIPQTWLAFVALWLLSISAWCAVDWSLYLLLHSGRAIEVDDDTPAFAREPPNGQRRPFLQWLAAWIGRELLALPIWTWAFWLGTKVEWRGKKFWVGMDMKVHEIYDTAHAGAVSNGTIDSSTTNSKARKD